MTRELADADCQLCGQHTTAAICARCVSKFLKVLTDPVSAAKPHPTGQPRPRTDLGLLGLLAELEAAVSRQDRIEGNQPSVYGRRADVAAAEHAAIPPSLRSRQGRIALPSTPWAIAPDAAAMLREARLDLARWVRHLRHAHGLIGTDLAGPLCAVCTHPSCGRIRRRRAAVGHRGMDLRLVVWLIRHRADLAQDDLAGEIVTDLTWHRNRIEAMVDRRDPDVFLGTCDAEDVKVDPDAPVIAPKPGACGAELYAHQGDKDITCPACGWLYNVERRKEKLRAIVYDEIRPVRDVADACAGLLTDDREEPVECTPTMIQGMQRHGRLAYRGTIRDPLTGRVSQLVRVGDVYDLLVERVERDRARRAKLSARPRKVSA